MASSGADVRVPETVHQALSAVANARGWKNPKLHIESGSNDGDGYLSALYRAEVRNGDESIHLMVKIMLASLGKSSIVEGAFRSEIFIYERILPAMEEIAHLRDPLPWPRGYQTESTCLVMQDMRPEGFAMTPRGGMLDGKQCKLLVTQLARFHGAGMALDKLRPHLIADFKKVVDDPVWVAEMRRVYTPFIKSSTTGPATHPDLFLKGSPVHEKLSKLFSTFDEDFFNDLLPDHEGGNTIVHGDCHINNVLFRKNAAGEAEGCCLIDFQVVRYAFPTPDLCTILLSNTEKATRDEHWDALMRTYHEELQGTLRAAGIKDPDAVYSWELFQAQMRRGARMALCLVPVMVHIMNDTAAIKEVQNVLEELTGDKNDATDAYVAFRDTPVVRHRFHGAVQSMVEWGWL